MHCKCFNYAFLPPSPSSSLNLHRLLMVLVALRINMLRLFGIRVPPKVPLWTVAWTPLYSAVLRSQSLHQKCVGNKDPVGGMGKISVVKGIQQVWQDCGREAGQKKEGGTEHLRKDQEPWEMLEGAWPPDKVIWDWGLLGLPTPGLSSSCIQWPSAPFSHRKALEQTKISPHGPQLLVAVVFTLASASRTG